MSSSLPESSQNSNKLTGQLLDSTQQWSQDEV